MRKFENDFPKYVSRVFKERLKQKGMSQYRFINEHAEAANRGTLRNILRGSYATNITTLAHYADLLGLDIIIRPKEQDNEIDD